MFKARFALVAVLGAALTAQGADLTKGTPDLKSAGPLAFGPNGLLFVGDAQGGAIFAIDTADRTIDSAGGTIKVEGDQREGRRPARDRRRARSSSTTWRSIPPRARRTCRSPGAEGRPPLP